MTDRAPARRVAARRLAVFGPAAIVLIVGTLSFGALRRSLATREAVIHSRTVLDASSNLLAVLLEAESAQRGFIITRDSVALQPYRDAPARIDSLLNQLRDLTRDNPDQQARLDTLAGRVHDRLAWMDSSVSIPSVTAAIAQRSSPISTPESRAARRRTTAEARRLLVAIDNAEDQLLRDRERSERESSALTSAVLVLGTIAAAILALLVNRSLDGALRDRRAALNEAHQANELLQGQATELETQAEAAHTAALDAEEATEQALHARRSAQESERRAERLQLATEAFSGALALSEVAHLVVDQAMAALGADSGALAGYNDTSEVLQFIAVRNVTTASIGHTIAINDDGPMTASVRNAQPVLLPNEASIRTAFPGLADAHALEEVQAVAAFPLAYGGQVLGSLLVRWRTPRALTTVDVSFMNALSRIAAESFDRARLFDAEREARTEAEGANRAKAAFLASMSHELRTPLQAALGFAQLVRSEVYGPINDAQAEALGRVERSQTHLARLIDDVLDFARLEAGRVRLRLEPVAINEVFTDLAPLVESQALAKRVDLTFSPPTLMFRVLVDRQRLQQVLVNLVGNAIKFTPEGGTIRVAARRAGDRGLLQVCDTGVGIPADRLAVIFEPFVQVDDTLTRAQPGTGLGLAISRDFARAMSGDITVESELGKGSTFSVILPIAGRLPPATSSPG
ncbi:MAG TPA: ATP-binding protein [Gemmatimonadaceae bacterium]|jgi:signal transduction histidine kinase/CHASE3 domain sensor protein|nr:ATP-binding protein [Gemmatimonadaceae bacterium]